MASVRVAIVGAGIGGIAAALWLHDLAIPFDWFEASDTLGGTLRRVGNPIDEYPGLDAEDGPALIAHFSAQLIRRGLRPQLRHTCTSMEANGGGWRLELRNTNEGSTRVVHVDAVVLATGTTPRLLGIAHESARIGRGIELSVTRNRSRVRGEEVAIVGGGDAALEGALLLAPHVPRIHLIHRRDRFRAQRRFIDAALALPQIVVHAPDAVTSLILPDDPTAQRLDGIRLASGRVLPVSTLFVRLGVAPHVPEGLVIDRDAQGYVQDDGLGRTTLPRLYVVGDCGTGNHQSVSWAVGSAARAVATLSRDLDLRIHGDA